MRLLVLGGTAFLSRAVAREAVGRGHEVTCACRGESGPVPAGARHLPLDRGRAGAAAVLASYARVDAVVDVARTPSWVREAVAAVPGAHWVLVSSMNVYGDTTTPGGTPGTLPLVPPVETDEDPMSAPEVYGGMKVACERLVREGAASSSIVRAGLIVGPGDPTGRFAYWPARLADTPAPEVLAPGSPEDPVQLVDVRDLAAWLVDLAEARVDGVFHGAGAPLTRGAFLTEVAEGVGAGEATLTWVPQEFLLAQQVEPWAGPRSLPLWLPLPEYAGFLTHDVSASYQAGLRIRPLATTARDTLAWLRTTPGAPVIGLSRAEEAEVLTAWAATRGASGRGHGA